MWTLVYNSTLLLHWNVNSLWAVHNEAMREFPYWKYYHFTQRFDCIPLKADANRKRIGCNILTQLHLEEDPDQLHYVHHYLNLDVKRQRLSDHMTGVCAIVSFSGSCCFVSSCLRWNLHVCLTHRPQAWLEGLVHRIWLSVFEHGLWGQLKSSSARPMLPVGQKSPSLCVLMTQQKVKNRP